MFTAIEKTYFNIINWIYRKFNLLHLMILKDEGSISWKLGEIVIVTAKNVI